VKREALHGLARNGATMSTNAAATSTALALEHPRGRGLDSPRVRCARRPVAEPLAHFAVALPAGGREDARTCTRTSLDARGAIGEFPRHSRPLRWLIDRERSRCLLASSRSSVSGPGPASRRAMSCRRPEGERRGASEMAARVLQRVKSAFRYAVIHHRIDTHPIST